MAEFRAQSTAGIGRSHGGGVDDDVERVRGGSWLMRSNFVLSFDANVVAVFLNDVRNGLRKGFKANAGNTDISSSVACDKSLVVSKRAAAEICWPDFERDKAPHFSEGRCRWHSFIDCAFSACSGQGAEDIVTPRTAHRRHQKVHTKCTTAQTGSKFLRSHCASQAGSSLSL